MEDIASRHLALLVVSNHRTVAHSSVGCFVKESTESAVVLEEVLEVLFCLCRKFYHLVSTFTSE